MVTTLFLRINFVKFLEPFAKRRRSCRHGHNMQAVMTHPATEPVRNWTDLFFFSSYWAANSCPDVYCYWPSFCFVLISCCFVSFVISPKANPETRSSQQNWGRLVDRSISLAHLLAGSLPDPLAQSLARSLPRPLTHSIARSLPHPLTRSLTRSLGHPLAHSLTQLLGHSLTYSLTRSLGHSLAHSLARSLAR